MSKKYFNVPYYGKTDHYKKTSSIMNNIDHLDQLKENYSELILEPTDISFDDTPVTSSVFKNAMVTLSIKELNDIQAKAKLSEQLQIQLDELREEIEMLKQENKELQEMMDK